MKYWKHDTMLDFVHFKEIFIHDSLLRHSYEPLDGNPNTVYYNDMNDVQHSRIFAVNVIQVENLIRNSKII